ncbi:MAG: hypothetical protein AB7F89_07010, partial [Pirellulaceae bacterium]
ESAAESSGGEGEGPVPVGDGYGAISPASLPLYASAMADEPRPAAAPPNSRPSETHSDLVDMPPRAWPREALAGASSVGERAEISPRDAAVAPALRSWQATWVDERTLAAEPRGTIDGPHTSESRLDEDFDGPDDLTGSLSDSWLDLDELLSEIAEEQGSARGR